MLEGPLVVDPSRLLDAVRHAFLQSLQRPLRKCDADDRNVEVSTFHHRIESGKDHFVGEITRHTVDHKSIRLRGAHQRLPSCLPSFLRAAEFGYNPDDSLLAKAP